jgi:predicted RNase H-like HicB family nuclease
VKATRTFTVVIERDEDGYYVATVPGLRGCHTQARNLDTLVKRTREAIALCLENDHGEIGPLELVGIQQISV